MSSPRTSNITRSSSGAASSARRPAVEQLVDAGTVTPNVARYNRGYLATVSQSVIFANPTGSAGDFQDYMIRVHSTVSRSFTWDTLYRGSATLTLPASSTGGGAYDYLGFFYNAQSGTFDLLAKSFGYG